MGMRRGFDPTRSWKKNGLVVFQVPPLSTYLASLRAPRAGEVPFSKKQGNLSETRNGPEEAKKGRLGS